jgi:hypothetical protein
MDITNLLTFKVNLNRDGNIEIDLSAVNSLELERQLRKFGGMRYAADVSATVVRYFRAIDEMIKVEPTHLP